ncbi:DedA family protein [Trueperella sp. LYQ141]|uniref:DedA family protein n=1 Tax=Trueperella sp. LYQ141 TaxID=3391058 RepID=UPI0039832B96
MTLLLSATQSSAEISGITGWAVDTVEALGGIGVALMIALENVFPPLPSEIILPLAGFTASLGTTYSLAGAIIWATFGSLLGAWILYGLGRWFGRERTRAIFQRLPLVKISDVDATEAWFHKHNQSTVFFGRMLPIFRSLISLPAGVIKMNMVLFTVYTALGSLVWNSVLICAGYLLGEKWNVVNQYVDILVKIVVIAVILALAVWVIIRIRARRRG